MFGGDDLYRMSRQLADADPWKGDDGQDILGANVDIKTSLMRAGPDPLKYNLAVRPRERHPGWVYILALVDRIDESGAGIYLVGWARDEDLPPKVREKGPLAGAFTIRAVDLNPLLPFRWLA